MNDNTLATQLIDQLKGAKNLHDSYSSQFNDRYLINGKLLRDWHKYFAIHLPSDLNQRLCIEYSSKVMNLHQEATNYKTTAEARLAALRSGYNEKYREAFAKLVDEYKTADKKLPAKDTLASLAESQCSLVGDSVTHAEIEVEFWKSILVDLANCRKHLDLTTINLSTEAKALSNEKYIDALNRNDNRRDRD